MKKTKRMDKKVPPHITGFHTGSLAHWYSVSSQFCWTKNFPISPKLMSNTSNFKENLKNQLQYFKFRCIGLVPEQIITIRFLSSFFQSSFTHPVTCLDFFFRIHLQATQALHPQEYHLTPLCEAMFCLPMNV